MSTNAHAIHARKRAEILAHATFVFGSREAAKEWLNAPARALEGRRPAELLETQTGTQVVEDLLQRLDFGVYV